VTNPRTLWQPGWLLGLAMLGTCEARESPVSRLPTEVASVQVAQTTAAPAQARLWMTVGERRFAITLADNEAARAFAELLPLTLDMPDLNGNEKHVELPKALPTKTSRPGTIRKGDLMLYGSRTLVLFYLTFESSYSYTRLGRVDDAGNLTQALGQGGARITFSRN
jgi:hypothetical protein